MKRSQINENILGAKDLLKRINFTLPCFAYWTMDEWKEHKEELERIRSVMQGWDVTDYGVNDFEKLGGVLFTIRNGNVYDPTIGTPYAEKIIALKDGQSLPLHFHYKKTEDIINRGGGILAIQLYNAKENYDVDYDSDVVVYRDGLRCVYKPGEIIKIGVGDSISLTPYMYHLFWALEGAGDLLVGEVSAVNDDNIDNYFAEKFPRFGDIEEDEAPIVPLCNEYAKWLD